MCVIKLAKDAPAPRATNNEGRAQQTNVDEEAKSEKIFAVSPLKIVSIPVEVVSHHYVDQEGQRIRS